MPRAVSATEWHPNLPKIMDLLYQFFGSCGKHPERGRIMGSAEVMCDVGLGPEPVAH